MQHPAEAENGTRQRCYGCFRPIAHCFCHAIPHIDNRTDVLIVQHVRERFHPFNTARIVHKALRRCRLIVDHNRHLMHRELPIQSQAGLLFPGADAQDLAELPRRAHPSQLVIIDGTWHQAKTIVRDVPQLRELPRYRLTPSSPGEYQIRREPTSESLSTLEATTAALRTLEPKTSGLDELLVAFRTMVKNQLGHPASHVAWRRKKDRQSRPRNIPRALLQDTDRLVVAYGEATPGRIGQHANEPLPVNWLACRLGACRSGTVERFDCHLRQTVMLPQEAMNHMRLSSADFADAVSPEEFRQRWRRFLRRGDVVVVYHQRTFQLLRSIGAFQPQCLVLKSVFGRWRSGFHCLEDLLIAEGLKIPAAAERSRAAQRLDGTRALVEHLRTEYAKLPGVAQGGRCDPPWET